MKRLSPRRALALAGLLIAGLVSRPAPAAQAPLTADDIVLKAVQRAESPACREARPDYHYTRQTVTEALDTKGNLNERSEKLYDVFVSSGFSSLKLLQLDGRNLSAAELQKQDERELAERRKMMDSKATGKGDERENFLNPELVARYRFTLLGEKPINGRAAYVLAFAPKSSKLPAHKLTDRFLNQVAGTVWIDKQDFEIARAETHLQAEVALWGGMIGTLRQCNYTLERTRLPDGVWFNNFSHGFFEGRKLLEAMIIRTRSQANNFRRVDHLASN